MRQNIQKILKKKKFPLWPSNAIDHNAVLELRNIVVFPHAHVLEFVSSLISDHSPYHYSNHM